MGDYTIDKVTERRVEKLNESQAKDREKLAELSVHLVERRKELRRIYWEIDAVAAEQWNKELAEKQREHRRLERQIERRREKIELLLSGGGNRPQLLLGASGVWD